MTADRKPYVAPRLRPITDPDEVAKIKRRIESEGSPMICKIIFEEKGAHVHASLFMGQTPHALGKCGDLVMRDDEWKHFVDALALAALSKASGLEVITEHRFASEGPQRRETD